MNGPHGLYTVNLDIANTSVRLNPPFEVHEKLKDTEEGITTVYLYVSDTERVDGMRYLIANAFCDFVQDDYATRDAAAQWLLDMATLRHGGG